MKNIENIIFDLGGVILDIDYNLTRKGFEDLGVKQFDEMYSQANANQLFQKLETGHVSNEEFFQELERSTNLGLTPHQMRTAWDAMLLDFRESSLEFLSEIKTKYNLYLFSNTNFIHMEAFHKIYHQKEREHPFNDYFKVPFYSCEIGFRKPDQESYKWILNHLRIEADKTLFIDDSIQNIEAAKEVGMQTIYFEKGMRIENLNL
ncbi:MAG: HAD family phosphatase [Ginsengibacter sp.]